MRVVPVFLRDDVIQMLADFEHAGSIHEMHELWYGVCARCLGERRPGWGRQGPWPSAQIAVQRFARHYVNRHAT